VAYHSDGGLDDNPEQVMLVLVVMFIQFMYLAILRPLSRWGCGAGLGFAQNPKPQALNVRERETRQLV
jgi:hypothetical protein